VAPPNAAIIGEEASAADKQPRRRRACIYFPIRKKSGERFFEGNNEVRAFLNLFSPPQKQPLFKEIGGEKEVENF